MEVKVTGTTFYRNTGNMSLVNRDVAGLEEYKTKRRYAELQKQEINNLKREFEDIKSDVKDIKILMQKLLEKDTNG